MTANLAVFSDILNHIIRNGGFGTAEAPNLSAQRHGYDVNVSKQITLLDGVDIGMPKWRVSMGVM